MNKKQYNREYQRKRRAGEPTTKDNGLSYLIPKLDWKDIPGYPGYMASSCGQIRSLPRPSSLGDIVLKQSPDTKDRLQVKLYIDKKKKMVFVHRLVYLAWHGDIPSKMVIDHIDGNYRNNHKDNLQLLTVGQNNSKGYQDAYNKGYQQALKDLDAEIVFPEPKIIASVPATLTKRVERPPIVFEDD